MYKYTVSEVVPSIRKIKQIKDVFQKEYMNFIRDFSEEAFYEYSRYMKALQSFPRNDDEADFINFEEAFFNQEEAWNFIRDIIKLFDLLDSYECNICIVKATCYVNMTDEKPDIDRCDEVYEIRDFKIGFILFLYLKYFRTEKASLIYD